MASNTIDNIIAAICEIEAGIPLPAGATHAPLVTVEPPDSFDNFPLFLNIEQDEDTDTYRAFGYDNGPVVHSINAYLLFAPAEQKYSMRERRVWARPVVKAFESDTTNLGGTCNACYVSRPRHGTVSINGMDMLALITPLRILAQRD